MGVYNHIGTELSSVYGGGGSELDYAYNSGGTQIYSKVIPPPPPPPVYEVGLNLLNSSYPCPQSPQGMATYGGYIFQYFSTVQKMNIYLMSDYSLVSSISCNVIGHGNNLQFGKVVQSSGFPLLYCSDSESADARYIYVLSIDLISLSLVDTIVLPADVANFPNGVIDFDNERIYTVGYTASSVYTTSGRNVVCVLDLNNPSTVIATWDYAYLGVMQGLVWDGEHIVLNCNTYNGNKVTFYFINPTTHDIDLEEQFDKEYQSPLDSEYQGFSFEQSYYLVSKWVYKNYPESRSRYLEYYSYVPDWGEDET